MDEFYKVFHLRERERKAQNPLLLTDIKAPMTIHAHPIKQNSSGYDDPDLRIQSFKGREFIGADGKARIFSFAKITLPHFQIQCDDELTARTISVSIGAMTHDEKAYVVYRSGIAMDRIVINNTNGGYTVRYTLAETASPITLAVAVPDFFCDAAQSQVLTPHRNEFVVIYKTTRMSAPLFAVEHAQKVVIDRNMGLAKRFGEIYNEVFPMSKIDTNRIHDEKIVVYTTNDNAGFVSRKLVPTDTMSIISHRPELSDAKDIVDELNGAIPMGLLAVQIPVDAMFTVPVNRAVAKDSDGYMRILMGQIIPFRENAHKFRLSFTLKMAIVAQSESTITYRAMDLEDQDIAWKVGAYNDMDQYANRPSYYAFIARCAESMIIASNPVQMLTFVPEHQVKRVKMTPAPEITAQQLAPLPFPNNNFTMTMAPLIDVNLGKLLSEEELYDWFNNTPINFT
jgi:hypothetical protein